MINLIKDCQRIIDHSTYNIQNAKVIEEANEYLEVITHTAMPHRILDESVDVVITAIEKMLLEGFDENDIIKHIKYKIDRTNKEIGVIDNER